METILELKNISKEYQQSNFKNIVLKKVNLKLHKKEFVGLIGPSGSGKSTLLHISALLDKPTSGQIFINDNNCHNINEEKRNLVRKKYIGFVYQNFFLLNDFTSLENVIIPQLLNGITYKKAESKAKDILKNIGLSKKLNSKPKELSGGEKQRVAISRAVANNPDIIFADEPTGNLDIKNSNIIMKLFLDLISEYKISIIVAPHNLSLTKKFDKVLKISDGIIK